LVKRSITPHVLLRHDLRYAWTRLSKDSRSDVIGIFYDALSIRSGGMKSIMNIGITQDIKLAHSTTTQELPRIPMLWYIPPIRRTIVTDGYLSIGNLSHTQRLRVCRVGPRLTGMLIHHTDGSIDVLGQWNYPQGTISEIYNNSDGILTSIAFGFSGEVDASYVDGIFVKIGHTDPFENLNVEQQLRVFRISNINLVGHYRHIAGHVGLTYT
jgi:hypothetical protein